MKNVLKMAMALSLGAVSLNAAGTAAGTLVDNIATLDFDVAAVAQAQQSTVAGDADFVVDNKIDMTVVSQDVAEIIGAPSDEVVTTFIVTNTGNLVQDYILTAFDDTTGLYGTVDNYDPGVRAQYVEDGTTVGYQAGEDTVTYIDELAPDASVTVYIVQDIPAAGATGDASEAALVAQAAAGGGAAALGAAESNDDGTADDPDNVDIVFADNDGAGAAEAAEDGYAADLGVVEVLIPANLSIVKTSMVIKDVRNGVDNLVNPKNIPGATIRYCFTVDNTGGGDGDNVVITDTLNVNGTENLTIGNSGFILQDIATACDCAAIVDASGVYADPTATITLGTVTGTPTPATQRGCAYIEAVID